MPTIAGIGENGGEIRCGGETWWLHPVFDETSRSTIQRSASHLARETDFDRARVGYPAGAVSIARNDHGDALVVLPPGNEIHSWNRETHACVPVDDAIRWGWKRYAKP